MRALRGLLRPAGSLAVDPCRSWWSRCRSGRRWFAISRAVSPALSSLVATVLRNVWLRAHGKPASSKSFRMARTVFDRSRRIPFGLPSLVPTLPKLLPRSQPEMRAATVVG